MSCEICGRNSCTRSFHSIEEQDRFDRGLSEEEAEIESLRAELAAANAMVEKLEDHLRAKHYYNGGIGFKQLQEIEKLQQQLAAAQLANKRLVEAIKEIEAIFYTNPLSAITACTEALSSHIDTAALDAYVEPWRKDAERYRWLRERLQVESAGNGGMWLSFDWITPEGISLIVTSGEVNPTLDAAIDAAITDRKPTP